MSLTLDLLQAIDARVAEGERNVTAMGVVVSRTTATDALVVFDGSQSSIPCKVSTSADAYEGDRVLLARFGSWWIVVGAMNYRGARKLTVVDRNSRPLVNLSEGDAIHQADTDIDYWWNGSVWVPFGGQAVFSWVRGPGLAANNRLLSNVGGGQQAYLTSTIQVEPSMEYTISASMDFVSGVAGTHFFKSFIWVGGGAVADAGEKQYTGGNGPVRLNYADYPYLTGASETTLVLELRTDNGAALNYDVYADPTRQAYLHLIATGRTVGAVAT